MAPPVRVCLFEARMQFMVLFHLLWVGWLAQLVRSLVMARRRVLLRRQDRIPVMGNGGLLYRRVLVLGRWGIRMKQSETISSSTMGIRYGKIQGASFIQRKLTVMQLNFEPPRD